MSGNPKKALITGISGQDGSYLAEYLLQQGYEVIGVSRRPRSPNLVEIESHSQLKLVPCDIADQAWIHGLLNHVQPDEIYNLAALSHVGSSFEHPGATFASIVQGVLHILDWCRTSPATRLYQASSSEMFGGSLTQPPHKAPYQDEQTPFAPNSPYAAAKLAAHNLVRVYRTSYNLFACCGILFNHESPRRGFDFVTRKITNHIGRWRANPDLLRANPLQLGNLHACRDWGYAPDYVRAMHLMLTADEPDDYVVATGETHTVGEFLVEAFQAADLEFEMDFIRQNDVYRRPCEVHYLRGNSEKIRNRLGWRPTTSFRGLVQIMVDADLRTYAS